MRKTYSVAIRTLGTAGEKYIKELESLHAQTILPEKIIVYIAEGYERPKCQVGMEEYVWVKKGMVAQRALRYEEIDSDYILLLDDDVVLSPKSAEELLICAITQSADCVAADTFKNQDMSSLQKVKAIITNLVFPRPSDGWAFKIQRNGSFSYNNRPPQKGFCLTQSFAGPAALWKKSALLGIKYEDELWMENLDYPHGNDFIHSYKLYRNGYKSGVLYGCEIVHLDAAVSSQKFKKSPKRLYYREKGFFAIWYRAIYSSSHGFDRLLVLCSFTFKAIWLLLVHFAIVIPTKSVKSPYYYVKGLVDGYKFVHSNDFKSLPPFIVNKSLINN